MTPLRQKMIDAMLVVFRHCDHCGFELHRYHSCRNRNYPKCQHKASQHRCRFLLHVLPEGWMRIYHYGFCPTALAEKILRSSGPVTPWRGTPQVKRPWGGVRLEVPKWVIIE